MLFRSKKTRKSSPQRSAFKGRRAFGRRCRLEPLEERRMLSAFNLADYGDPVAFTLFIEKDSPNNMKLYVNGASRTLASGTDVTAALAGAVQAGYALAA